MLKKSLKALFAALVVFTCASGKAITVDELICNMDKAEDPFGKGSSIKTMVVKGSINMPAQNMNVNVETKFKMPNSQIAKTVVPGAATVIKVFNGREGWEVSSLAGERLITGKELDNLKFSVAMDSINTVEEFKNIFSEMKFGEEAIIGGDACYQLVCAPKKEFNTDDPIKLFIDKKTYLIRKMEKNEVSAEGIIPLSVIFEDYKDFGGMMAPVKATTEMMGMKMIMTVEKIEFNVKIDESEFKMPESLSKTSAAPLKKEEKKKK